MIREIKTRCDGKTTEKQIQEKRKDDVLYVHLFWFASSSQDFHSSNPCLILPSYTYFCLFPLHSIFKRTCTLALIPSHSQMKGFEVKGRIDRLSHTSPPCLVLCHHHLLQKKRVLLIPLFFVLILRSFMSFSSPDHVAWQWEWEREYLSNDSSLIIMFIFIPVNFLTRPCCEWTRSLFRVSLMKITSKFLC